MPFRSVLPRDLQLLVLEFNSPPLLEEGLEFYLEWMWSFLADETDPPDKVTVEFCFEPVFSADNRYTPDPWASVAQCEPWEVRMTIIMTRRWDSDPLPEGHEVPHTVFNLYWENLAPMGGSLHVSIRRKGAEFVPLNLLDYAPRSIEKIPRLHLCPNYIKFDDVPGDISEYFQFHQSDMMAGPVRFRNAHLRGW